MKIAILGWGSLIWQPKELAYNKEFGWQKKGPTLKIEFARISKDGRLTLVITENGTNVPVLYALSNYQSLEEAVLNLAVREGSGRNSIGSYCKKNDTFSSSFHFEDEIRNWIKKTDFNAVIWTNLGENWNIKNDNGEIIRKIEPNNRIEYLKELKGYTSALAEEYIRRTPPQIQTHFRKLIEGELCWTQFALNIFEGTYQHPLIVCKHDLDLLDIESLGEFISKQMKLTIEIDDNLFFKKSIYNSIGTGEARLEAVKSSLIPEKRYILQLETIVLFIYVDFIEIKFNRSFDYFHLSDLDKEKELKEIDLFKNFFNQLKSIGIDEVHFGIFAEFEKDEGFTYCWNNIYRIMSKYDNYFKLEI